MSYLPRWRLRVGLAHHTGPTPRHRVLCLIIASVPAGPPLVESLYIFPVATRSQTAADGCPRALARAVARWACAGLVAHTRDLASTNPVPLTRTTEDLKGNERLELAIYCKWNCQPLPSGCLGSWMQFRFPHCQIPNFACSSQSKSQHCPVNDDCRQKDGKVYLWA